MIQKGGQINLLWNGSNWISFRLSREEIKIGMNEGENEVVQCDAIQSGKSEIMKKCHNTLFHDHTIHLVQQQHPLNHELIS